MPRQLTCRACGSPMWIGTGSLPQGQAMCRPCRAEHAGNPPRGAPPTACAWCKRPFRSVRSGSGWTMACSKACAQFARTGDRGRVRGLCEVCGKSYRKTYAGQRTCSRTCGGMLRYGPIEDRARYPSVRVRYADCAHCGRLFVSRGGAALCSDACRRERAECRRVEVRRLHAERNAHRYGRRPCSRCGEEFECGPRRGRPRRFCEPCEALAAAETRRAARDRRRIRLRRLNGAEYERIVRSKVYERDGWRCQLCRRPVDGAAKVPHPRAPTLDHVVPLSEGGSHTYANVQLACFLCNSLKGAGGGQQLAMFG